MCVLSFVSRRYIIIENTFSISPTRDQQKNGMVGSILEIDE